MSQWSPTLHGQRKRARVKRILILGVITLLLGAVLIPLFTTTSRAQNGRLRIGRSQEPATLNPVTATMQVESDAFALLFNGLVRFDDHGHVVPDLATQVPSQQNGGISSDGKVLTYHLDPRAKWQDGVPLTSADVKFTYEAIINPRTASPLRTGYDRIAHLETPDAHTVRILLTAPFAPAVADLFPNGAQGSILPKHLLQRYADLNRVDFATHPIGSGPYHLEAWHHGSNIIFRANREYFRGAPKIERLVWQIVPDDQTMLNKLRTHELDLATNVYPYAYETLGKILGMHADMVPATYHWEHLIFNCRKDPVDDRRVRLALAYTMDPQTIYRKIYRGYGTLGPTDQNPLSQWYNKHLGYYPHDIARANALLEEAGWHRAGNGIRIKAGKPLTLTFVTTAANRTREVVGVLLQNQWKQVGVDLQIKVFPPSTLFAMATNGGIIQSGRYDVALFAYFDRNADPDDINTIGPGKIPPGGSNFSFYRNPEVGRLQEAALVTYDVAARKRLYDRIQKILIADVPEYTLNWMAEIDITADRLHGFRPVPVGSDFWNAAEWTF
jgi:peptide/nickel transport system substrate-binding protein